MKYSPHRGRFLVETPVAAIAMARHPRSVYTSKYNLGKSLSDWLEIVGELQFSNLATDSQSDSGLDFNQTTFRFSVLIRSSVALAVCLGLSSCCKVNFKSPYLVPFISPLHLTCPCWRKASSKHDEPPPSAPSVTLRLWAACKPWGLPGAGVFIFIYIFMWHELHTGELKYSLQCFYYVLCRFVIRSTTINSVPDCNTAKCGKV